MRVSIDSLADVITVNIGVREAADAARGLMPVNREDTQPRINSAPREGKGVHDGISSLYFIAGSGNKALREGYRLPHEPP